MSTKNLLHRARSAFADARSGVPDVVSPAEAARRSSAVRHEARALARAVEAERLEALEEAGAARFGDVAWQSWVERMEETL